MLTTLLLALAINTQAPGPVKITEQQLTEYVNQKVKYEQQYGLPGLFDASIKLDRMTVALGRQTADLANVTGVGNFTLTLPNKPTVAGRIQANFEAKPRYEVKEGAVYFDNFALKSYELEPAALKQQFAPLVGYLVNSLEQRLRKQPAYRLNEQDKDQAWLKAHVVSMQMQPGELLLNTKESP
ncbi:MAG: DUF1439 domain-containing protein [Aeromonadaceae bacterium]